MTYNGNGQRVKKVVSGVTTIFLMLVGVLRGMDATLEEASSAAGATHRTTFFRVSMPLLTPALLAAVTYSFMTNLESLEIPIVIGVPAAIHVFPTYIYFTTQRFTPPEYGLAATLSGLLIAVCLVLVYCYRRIIGQANRFATITGKGYRPRMIALGRWRYVASLALLLYTFLLLIVPFLIVLWASLLPFYMQPSLEALSKLTLRNYNTALHFDKITLAVKNSLILGLASASVVIVPTRPLDQKTRRSPAAPIIERRNASSARLPSTSASVSGASGTPIFLNT